MTTIRPATEQDIAGIMKLLKEVLAVHHEGRPDLFKETGTKYTEEQLEHLIHHPQTAVFVCVDETNRVLGHCFCVLIDRPETSSSPAYRTLYIDDLCVAKQARRLHIGSRLYDYAERFAKEQGFYNITLHAWAFNEDAIAFYQEMGLQLQYYAMEKVIQ